MLPNREVTSTGRKPGLDLLQSLTRTLVRQFEDMLQGLKRELRIGLVAFINDDKLLMDSLQHRIQRLVVRHRAAGTDAVSGAKNGCKREGCIGTVLVKRRSLGRSRANGHCDVGRKAAAELVEEGGDDEHAAEAVLDVFKRLHDLAFTGLGLFQVKALWFSLFRGRMLRMAGRR